MSDPRLFLDDDRDGSGLAPPLLGGLLTGLTGAAAATLAGAGWWIVLAAYMVAGTIGGLLAATLAAGLLRTPRLPALRLLPTASSPDYALAISMIRRARR